MTTAAKPDAVKPNNATPNRGKRNSIASTQPMDSEPVRHIGVGIDAAGQYAANLEAFLRGLTVPMIVSIGEPKRNKDYHSVSQSGESGLSRTRHRSRRGILSPRFPAVPPKVS